MMKTFFFLVVLRSVVIQQAWCESTIKDAVEEMLPLVYNRLSQTCSNTCREVDCDAVTVRYGKYCGIRYSGCQGEDPCDDVDACCKTHDECVKKSHYLNTVCHSNMITCIQGLRGKIGFSKKVNLIAN